MTAKNVPPRALVVLEESTLTAMSVNPKIAAEFPVLKGLSAAAKSGGCGRCGAAAKARAQAYQGVKQSLAGMDGSRKRRLKELLNANKVRIVYRDAAGKTQSLTF